MADWTNIPNSSIETGKPGRAIDGRALRDNPIAIAEGAPGAPRVVPIANDVPAVFSGAITGTAYVAFTGLDDVASVLAAVKIGQSETGTSTALYVGFSSNGGASFGADQKLADMTSGQGLILDAHINLITGAVVSSGVNISASAASGAVGLVSSVTVPSGVNALRFRNSPVTRTGNITLQITGGRP